MYCSEEGREVPNGPCDAGWFCVRGAKSKQPADYNNYTTGACLCPSNSTGGRCQPGFYCPQQSYEPTKCKEGYYCPTAGLPTYTLKCKAGHYCNEGSDKPDPEDGIMGDICPAGKYCEEGTSTPVKCPAGTYSNKTGNLMESNCSSCTAGYYCATAGLTKVTGKCDVGFYCPGRDDRKDPPATACPKGYYCPEGSPDKVNCEAGKYQDEVQQGSCKVSEHHYLN
jgi:hypothetical protein